MNYIRKKLNKHISFKSQTSIDQAKTSILDFMKRD